MRQETSTALAVLDYAPPAPTFGQRHRHVIAKLRIGVFACLFGWGYWFALSFRCTGVGSTVAAMLLCTGIFAGPWACVAFFGVRWWRYVAIVAALVVLPALAADAHGTIEERLFIASQQGLPRTAPTVFKRRWWPNGSSYLYYDPATGRLGGGD